MRPILLNSCALAATAAEARYRIDAPIAPSRGVRVLALDPAAVAVVAGVGRRPWAAARFYTGVSPGRWRPIAGGAGETRNGPESATPLAAVLDGADAVVLVASTGEGAEQASAVGSACRARSIMTAGLVLGGNGSGGASHPDRQAAVAILRPHARVILVTDDEADVAEVLTALRA